LLPEVQSSHKEQPGCEDITVVQREPAQACAPAGF
jgi:hypothetical protein